MDLLTDKSKLLAVADWYDKYDDDRGYDGDRSVQRDLRRIAEYVGSMLDENSELFRVTVTDTGTHYSIHGAIKMMSHTPYQYGQVLGTVIKFCMEAAVNAVKSLPKEDGLQLVEALDTQSKAADDPTKTSSHFILKQLGSTDDTEGLEDRGRGTDQPGGE